MVSDSQAIPESKSSGGKRLSPVHVAKFVAAVMEGKSMAEAYRIAHDYHGPHAPRYGYRFAALEPVAAELERQRKRLVSKAVLTRIRKREILGQIAESQEAKNSDRIAAIRVDNEMTGDNAPVQIDATVSVSSVLSSIKSVSEVIDIPVTERIPGPGRSLPPPDSDKNA